MRFCTACGSRFDDEDVRFCPHDGQPLELRDDPLVAEGDPLLGQVVDGRYRIERCIGEGGMGAVYLATHTSLNKRMALKVLQGALASDPDVVQRFIQEAQASSSIGHPNIIDISDFGRLDDGSVYFVMEYLDGQSLTDLVASGPVPIEVAVPIVHQIASALSAAHARGIVHRDLKPDNVMLTHREDAAHFVKVVDFGIAKVGGANSKLTKTGMVFGTPHYMSPEQAAGQMVDARTDIYALGIIMYEMCTGRVPFDADTFMGILTKHMFEPPPPPTENGAGVELGRLEPVILRCLAKKPEDRYPTMDELAEDLARIAAGEVIAPAALAAPPPRDLRPSLVTAGSARGSAPGTEARDSGIPLPTRRGPLYVVGVLGLLALVALAVGLVQLLGGSDEAKATPVATSAAAPPAPAAAPPDVPPAPPHPEPEPEQMVRIESIPAGASVLVDGAIVGSTPLEMPKPTGLGSQLVELRMPGYDPQTVSISTHSSPSIEARLTPEQSRPARPVRRARSRSTMTSSEPAAMMAPARQHFASEVVDPWSN